MDKDTPEHPLLPDLPRRRMLKQSAIGFGHLALTALLARQTGAAPVDPAHPLAPRDPHFPARASERTQEYRLFFVVRALCVHRDQGLSLVVHQRASVV
ncbi:MAG: hypothetical protein QGH11_14365, partial [Pirellulaceae bacterium]|nr:hypothetical protein [Pirellulaceae bacterium]